MRKYNPHLKNMVTNVRESLEHSMKNSTLNYTDEELFNVIEYWSGCSDSEEEMEAVKKDVLDSVKR